MANEDKRRIITVEDYSAATTTDIIPENQVRWFDTVTGYNAAEIIELVGNGSDDIANLARRQWLTDSAQTLYGVKTFDDIPVLPADAPSSGDQAANKTYVDTQIIASLGLPLGHLTGLETLLAADTDHDITIAIGKARSFDDTSDLSLSAALTKRIDATWAEGDTNGGMFTGSVAVDTTYHLFIILKDSDGSTVDAGWDTDIDGANVPAGWSKPRRIASFKTNSGSNIRPYVQNDNSFSATSPSINAAMTISAINTNKQTKKLYDTKLPEGLKLDAIIRFLVRSNNLISIAAYDPAITLDLSSREASSVQASAAGENDSAECIIRTNVSAEIAITSQNNNNMTDFFEAVVMGWADDRGRSGGK